MFGVRAGFAGGIRLTPVARRATDGQVRQLPFAPLLRLPLRQHDGAAAVAAVRVGDEVLRGQLLARAEDERAVPLHAPATGRITRISAQPDPLLGTVGVIELAPLAGDTQEAIRGPAHDPDRHSAEALLEAIRQAGMVGLGGQASPTHLRLQRARARGVNALVINGIEGEPGLARVPALLDRHAADVLAGARCLARVLGVARGLLAVESPDEAVARVLLDAAGEGSMLSLHSLAPRYPQGAAELLLRTLSGRRLEGGITLVPDRSAVFSLATVAEIGRLLGDGLPMTDQLISLAGDGLREPGNYRVPLGTPVGFALAQAGLSAGPDRVLAGGPMRGQALGSLDRPIVKGATALTVVAGSNGGRLPQAGPCIRCGACVTVCPLNLHPAELGLLARKGEIAAMVNDWHLARCFECGCCDYVCPAHIPLAQWFRTAKGQWARAQAAAEVES